MTKPNAAFERTYGAESGKALFLSCFWGRGHGIILLEHLFLGIALIREEAVRGIQLPLQSRSLPTSNEWRKNPLVSVAYYRVVFEMPFNTDRASGPATLESLAESLREFCRSPDTQSNLDSRTLTKEELKCLGKKLHFF